MSIVDPRGLPLVGSDGGRVSLEPLSVHEKPPVLTDKAALAEVRNKLVGALTCRGYSQAEVAAILGVTTRTVKRRWAAVRPGAPIPKLAPVFGANTGWTPETEDWRSVPEICERCGGESGPIQPGAQLACVACGRTGFEAQVQADRDRDRYNEQRRAEQRRAEKLVKFAERRTGKGKRHKAG